MERYIKEEENTLARYLFLPFWFQKSVLRFFFFFADSKFFASALQTVAMKFIMKHGKSDKDVQNLRQEIEVMDELNTWFLYFVYVLIGFFENVTDLKKTEA